MIPIKSSSTSQGCDPISSNCVIWQGPDLPCVSVCNGDTISDVIAKLCLELVDLTGGTGNVAIDISGIDQSCLLDGGNTSAETLQELLQNIITKLCDANNVGSVGDACGCIIPLPECLKYTDSFGNLISELPLYNSATGGGYAPLLASRICNLISSINTINATIANHEIRITALENASGTTYTPPKVISTCLLKSGVAVEMETLLTAVESAFCALQTATGTPTQLYTAIGFQCANLGAAQMLNGEGTMSSLPGWVASPQNLAQSFTNAWLTICDLRNAVLNMQQTCCATSLCDGITYDIKASITKNNGILESINLDFSGSAIPATFSDCGAGSTVTITDTALNTITQVVSVSTLQNGTPLQITSFGGLDTNSNFTVAVNYCLTNGSSQCSYLQTVNIANDAPCPIVTLTNPQNTSFDYSVGPITLPSGYTVKVITQSSAGLNVQTDTYTNPSGTVSGTVSSLNPGGTYSVLVQIINTTGAVQSCPASNITINNNVCNAVLLDTPNYVPSLANFAPSAPTIELLCTAPSSDSIVTVAGFNSAGQPIVAQYASVGGCPSGAVNYTGALLTVNDPTTAVECQAVPYPSNMTEVGSGWGYHGAITSPFGVSYYIYSVFDIRLGTIPQVLFCCESKPKIAEIPPTAHEVGVGEVEVINVGLITAEGVTGSTIWEIVSQGTGGTAVVTSYNSKNATIEYTQNGTDPVAATDSFTVRLTNSRGISNIITITITAANVIAPCDSGMDVAFVMDYTGSMSGSITEAKNSIAAIVSEINIQSGTNDYRLSLVLADEYTSGTDSRYDNAADYISLPASQKYVNIGLNGAYQWITAMEMFQLNNEASFTTQLNKIDTPTFLLGSGIGTPEPTDMAIDLIINSDFTNSFRSGVAKYIVLITDATPGGNDDDYTPPDDVKVAELTQTCIDNGIKVLVLGTGADEPVWQGLATNTGGSFETSFTASTLISAIQNGCSSASRPCYNYRMIGTNDGLGCVGYVHFSYTDCEGVYQTDGAFSSGTSYFVCSQTVPVITCGSATVVNLGPCLP